LLIERSPCGPRERGRAGSDSIRPHGFHHAADASHQRGGQPQITHHQGNDSVSAASAAKRARWNGQVISNQTDLISMRSLTNTHQDCGCRFETLRSGISSAGGQDGVGDESRARLNYRLVPIPLGQVLPAASGYSLHRCKFVINHNGTEIGVEVLSALLNNPACVHD
jgi:hypothetical protein